MPPPPPNVGYCSFGFGFSPDAILEDMLHPSIRSFPPPTVAIAPPHSAWLFTKLELYISHTEDGSTNIAPPRASLLFEVNVEL